MSQDDKKQWHRAGQLLQARKEFVAKAEAGFDRMFGTDGQNGLVTFTEREERACAISDELARWLMEEHVSLDDLADPQGPTCCPVCGGPMPCESPEEEDLQERALVTRRGRVDIERAARHCPRCRRIFFPPG